ncbi:interleukin-6 receptor subunit beta [Cololabis saira]|uniref:interleukin-6 receptor subunit beta n=1 Tax=Cololabis saira TaxID=129043 RepID=UPI002AD44E1B|nr:interleukin-6 receptor subunit beta [Cololabis saira]
MEPTWTWTWTWTLMGLLPLLSADVTVKHTQLKSCEGDDRLCVSDLRDCGGRPPSSEQRVLNMSCYYQRSEDGLRSLTCSWTREPEPGPRTEARTSLILSSQDQVYSCPAILNPAAVLNVSVRIRDYRTGTETWSRPRTVSLFHAGKPPPPVLRVVGSTPDSVSVSWRSGADGGCRIRFRPDDGQTWTQIPGLVPAHEDQDLDFRIPNLRPLTAYRAAVACRGRSGFWSDWSSDVTGRTSERAPPRPSEMCYRLEETSGGRLLHLKWKADRRVSGFQLSVQPQGFARNVSDGDVALLLVDEGNCSVAVRAFNAAGFGPAAHLGIDGRRRGAPPPVRHMWVSSSYPDEDGLLVRWTRTPSSPSSPLSHMVVQLEAEPGPSPGTPGLWTRVDPSSTSAVIRGADPAASYRVSVFPVQERRCGPTRSLRASLQQGALLEPVHLKVLRVTKTSVTFTWTWQRKNGPIRVERYRAELKTGRTRLNLSLWPDQQLLTFSNLTPSTQYVLLLMADHNPRAAVAVTTSFDDVPVLASSPLLVLGGTMLLLWILSRTVYKWRFFPPVSSPRGSTTGQWLMDPNLQRPDSSILEIRDFQVVGEKTLVIRSLVVHHNHDDDDNDAFPSATGGLVDRSVPGEAPPPQDQEEVAQAPPSPRQAAVTSHELTPPGGCWLHGGPENNSSFLVCDTEYLENTCFGVKPAADRTADRTADVGGGHDTDPWWPGGALHLGVQTSG